MTRTKEESIEVVFGSCCRTPDRAGSRCFSIILRQQTAPASLEEFQLQSEYEEAKRNEKSEAKLPTRRRETERERRPERDGPSDRDGASADFAYRRSSHLVVWSPCDAFGIADTERDRQQFLLRRLRRRFSLHHYAFPCCLPFGKWRGCVQRQKELLVRRTPRSRVCARVCWSVCAGRRSASTFSLEINSSALGSDDTRPRRKENGMFAVEKCRIGRDHWPERR